MPPIERRRHCVDAIIRDTITTATPSNDDPRAKNTEHDCHHSGPSSIKHAAFSCFATMDTRSSAYPSFAPYDNHPSQTPPPSHDSNNDTPMNPFTDMTPEKPPSQVLLPFSPHKYCEKKYAYDCYMHGGNDQSIKKMSFDASYIRCATIPDQIFFGHCYQCGGIGHSQKFCPGKQCTRCRCYGHSEQTCPQYCPST